MSQERDPYTRRPCPKCGKTCDVVNVQNDWNRGIPVRFRGKGFIRRKLNCSDPGCDHSFWTLEVPEETISETVQNTVEECAVEG